jgi:hypothetical protein
LGGLIFKAGLEKRVEFLPVVPIPRNVVHVSATQAIGFYPQGMRSSNKRVDPVITYRLTSNLIPRY